MNRPHFWRRDGVLCLLGIVSHNWNRFTMGLRSENLNLSNAIRQWVHKEPDSRARQVKAIQEMHTQRRFWSLGREIDHVDMQELRWEARGQFRLVLEMRIRVGRWLSANGKGHRVKIFRANLLRWTIKRFELASPGVYSDMVLLSSIICGRLISFNTHS